ncbi:hypothetical protein CWO91_37615 [Bradyrhizobium genosp. SA-3]|uniref:acyl-CoA dehydrogenase family protein n=1 Tax=Bradyrhizobium genosp. SA-3 TaxID=508868 RepID=UPI00102A0B1C|nr:hypothetical protein CWO91_37615 [Bradyrhizobium genosp. SA-3]
MLGSWGKNRIQSCATGAVRRRRAGARRFSALLRSDAKQRIVFEGPLSDKQSVQSMIVYSWIEIQRSRLMMYACAQKDDRGEGARVEAGIVKMTATATELVGPHH